jgi:hypothetical protein
VSASGLVELRRLLTVTGSGPWQATNDVQTAHGDNWWMASTGTGSDGEEWHVCTKNVPVSEGMATAEAVAKFTATAKNVLPTLFKRLDELEEENYLLRIAKEAAG